MADDAAEEEPLRGKFFFENGATYEGEYAVLPPDPEAEVKDGEEPKERRIRQGQGDARPSRLGTHTAHPHVDGIHRERAFRWKDFLASGAGE